MKLEELKKMIKEEFDNFQMEAPEDEVDVTVDADEAESDESMDTLRKIYNMLKPMFEEEPMEEPVADEMEEDITEEDMVDEVKDDKDKMEEADLEERAGQGFGDPGNKNTTGANVGYTPAKTTKGDGKLHENKTNLQERFQKLANIIK
tara:strand:+ start:62 stop:505 length:444 start_codon:yes stop_codon:yes gene_type:complete